jgi:ATP-dependent DNA helicase RecG
MTIENVNILLQQGEGLKIEFKDGRNGVPDSLYETVVSFLNTDGGTILIGVDNDATISVLTKSQVDQYITDISTALNDRHCINPVIIHPILAFQHPDGNILIMQIPSSSQIHDHGGRVFIRQGDADIDITNNQSAIRDLHLRKANFYSESEILSKLTINDLDPDLFDKAKQIIRGARPSHPWLAATNEQILKDSLLWRTDFQTGEAGLTLAAALIFGKDSTIQSILPAYKAEALVRIFDKDRYDDRLTLRTNLIDTYIQLMDFIRRHLPEKFYMEDDQRKDLRDIIFREIIGNLIIHREYRSGFSSDIIIGKNSVIFTNPNKPLFHGPLDLDRFSPYPKNPNIRRFFTAFGWADEIGSGVRNTRKYLAHYVPGADPLFFEHDLFRTEIPLVTTLMSEFVFKFKHWLGLPDETAAHLETGLNQILLDPSVAENGWDELILFLVPTWHQKGTNLVDLDWPKKQVITSGEIKKVPTWTEKGANLMHKKAMYLLSILFLSSTDISIEKLMQWMNYKNRPVFRSNYLIPLQKSGLIAMTNPQKPNDPEQKYKLTEKGKLFLSGRNIDQ